MRSTADDRTTRARIRDAAIRCFAEHGRAATTARRVAAAADVSPGSVMHHFETMDGLRRACDEHVLARIREIKLAGADEGLDFDLAATVRRTRLPWLAAYLARMLTDAEAAAPLVDEMVDDAEVYLERMVSTGQVRPSSDPRARAVLMTLQALGQLVLHEHLHRLLGVDITQPDLDEAQALAYARPMFEMYAQGLLTPEFVAANAAMLADADADDRERGRDDPTDLPDDAEPRRPTGAAAPRDVTTREHGG